VSERGDTYRVYLDGGVGQDLDEATAKAREPIPTRDTPFCLGIVGPFSGMREPSEGGDAHEAVRKPLRRVTPENVRELTGLNPILMLGQDAGATRLRFRGLDDFHPDELVRQQEIFRPLREERSGIAPGEEASGKPGAKEGRSAEMDPEKEPEREGPGSGAGLLDAVLGETGNSAPSGPEPSSLDEDLDDFVRRAVRPHLVDARTDPDGRKAATELRMADLLRRLLHDPRFQELEALWRSVVFLLSRIQVGTNLRVYLVDVSEAELMEDLLSTDEPTEWGFAHTILNPVSEHGEALRWGALIGAFRFGHHPLHVPLLQRLGLLAESAQVPWISGADGTFLGCESLSAQPDPRDWNDPTDPLWEELREHPEAEWIHLALPGFLLRAPYGPDGAPTKTLAFDEKAEFPGDLLWGNPAILAGLALAERFSRSGWSLDPGGRHEATELPLAAGPDGHLTCVEIRLSQTAASEVRQRGLNPVLSPRNEPRLFLEGWRSISTSPAAFMAWWQNPG